MSELVVVLNQLNKDIEAFHELLMDAERNKDEILADQIAEELSLMKEMAMHIEQPEISRHLRLVQNEEWKEYTSQR
jgi:hypothetical protein